MGIDLNCAQLLIRAKQNGACFDRMATLGRQELHANRADLLAVLQRFGYVLSTETRRNLLDPTTVYSEGFLGLLGARQVVAIDASDYEGAQIVHDMNMPIPDHLKASFDFIFDGGTLEHVFEFPVAIKNCMHAVRLGGQFVSFTMANNFCGHGFYQFSPELFFRLLSSGNGYKMESCIEWEAMHGSRFFEVPDPASLGDRIELTSRSGTFLFIQAKRIGDPSVVHPPHQSDYASQWEAAQVSQTTVSENPVNRSRNRFRAILKRSPLLHSGVLSMRKWARGKALLRRWMIQRDYRRRLLHRNSRRYLRPLKDLRVSL